MEVWFRQRPNRVQSHSRPWFRPALAATFVALWIFSAVHPVDSGVWMLENVLTLLAVVWVLSTHSILPLSNLSWFLIVLFLLLHEVGAHYTYEKVPFGFWIRPLFGLVRNDYDRIVHFSFGLLLSLPCYESMRRSLHGPRWLLLMTPMMILSAMSAFYEIAEAYSNLFLAPFTAAAYLSLQGDPFDSQNDMAAAVAGSILALLIIAVFERRDAAV